MPKIEQRIHCLSRLLVLLFACGVARAKDTAQEKMPSLPSDNLRVYFGCMTSEPNAGIYASRFDRQTGQLSPAIRVANGLECSFLAVDETHQRLYAIEEIQPTNHALIGAITAYAIDRISGNLTLINRQLTDGGGFCHLSLDRNQKYVLAARYDEGNAVVLPIHEDGSVGPVISTVRHTGSGPNKARQENAHPHWIGVDAANRFAFVVDLGIDQIRVYGFDETTGQLLPHQPAAVTLAGGSGPRHLAFDPENHHAYVINELSSSIAVFAYEGGRGTFSVLQTASLLPSEFHGQSTAGEVVMHPSGNFVYGSNRGHDSLAIFRRDASSGRLTPGGYAQGGIRHPRHFAIDPSGRWLLCANRDLDNVTVYRIDLESGGLSAVPSSVKVPQAACVVFVK